MEGLWVGLLIGAVVAMVIGFIVRRSKKGSGPSVSVHGSIEEMKAIGELHVFRVVTKEIVTAKDHAFGIGGTKYFEWLLSSKKMAMIFEFDIEFSYDLKDQQFSISQDHGGGYLFAMPPCRYDIHIKDVEFYDEQRSRLLPKLLPELIGDVFSAGFGEEQRNQLKDEARRQAEALANNMVGRLMSDVRGSAETTLSSIAKSFGVTQVSFTYSQDSEADARSIQMSDDVLNDVAA